MRRTCTKASLVFLVAAAIGACGGSVSDGTGPDESVPQTLEPWELCADYSSRDIASFADAGVESDVRLQLRLGVQAPLTCGALSGMTVLGLGQRASHASEPFRIVGVTSIVGVQNLTGLSVLSLDNNDIEDISLLAGLGGLERLNLQRNNITDISPLRGLANLTDLRLAGALLRVAVTPPQFMRDGVCEPDLGPAPTSTFSDRPTAGADIASTASSWHASVPPIGGRNRIENLDDLTHMSGLTFLTAGAPSSSTDIAGVGSLTNLECLALSGVLLPGLSVLADLTNLKELQLTDGRAVDIGALSGLSELTALYLDNNSIADLAPLANLHELRALGLGHNLITNVEPLSDLRNLLWLDLRGNTVTDLKPLIDNPGLADGDRVFVDRCDGTEALTARGVRVITSAGPC